VWVTVVNTSGASTTSSANLHNHTEGSTSRVVRANSNGTYDRTEVMVVANPPSVGGFVVAWSSWGEDGDGWGVFARRFNSVGSPIDDQLQVNEQWQHFQWQPLLAWCGDSLWAFWGNATRNRCDDGGSCTSGPIVRRLGGADDLWSPSTEVKLEGSKPMSGALACTSDGSAVPFWLEDGGKQVRWEVVKGSGEILRAEPRKRLPLEVFRKGSSFSKLRHGDVSPLALRSVPLVDIALLAHDGFLVVLSNNAGALEGQLLNIGRKDPKAYPKRRIAEGTHIASAAWDTSGSQPTLVICWWANVETNSDVSHFACGTHHIQWFTSNEDLWVVADMCLIMLCSVFLLCCLFRHCAQACHTGQALRLFRFDSVRRFFRTRRPVLSSHEAHMLELREQLSQIPVSEVESSSSPTAEAPRPVIHHVGCSQNYEITVDKSDGSRIGLEVSFDKKGENTLLIKAVKGGLALQWNYTHEDCQVRRGDRIVEVNSIGGNTDAMVKELKRNKLLHIKLRRATVVGSSSASSVATSDSNDGSSSAGSGRTCPICWCEVVMRVALQPCGHTACRDCVVRLVELHQACHICRGDVTSLMPVYV